MANLVEAVIFDWAGTTMDYGCYAPAVVFMDVFKAKGVDITMEEARRPMGKHKRLHIEDLVKMESVREKWKKEYKCYPESKDVEEMFAVFVPKQLAVLPKYSNLIDGTLDVMDELRDRGKKIGSTTGYIGEMMDVLLFEAAARHYIPDISVCSGHYAKRFGGGYALNKDPVIGFSDNISRPGPNMCNLNAVLLGVSANERCVKVGDTLDDIREGKRAGMWTIALAGTGNEMYLLEEHEGKTEKEVEAIDPVGYQKKILKAYQNMAKEEPSFIVKSIREVPPALEQIESMIRRGYIPQIVKTQYLY